MVSTVDIVSTKCHLAVVKCHGLWHNIRRVNGCHYMQLIKILSLYINTSYPKIRFKLIKLKKISVRRTPSTGYTFMIKDRRLITVTKLDKQATVIIMLPHIG